MQLIADLERTAERARTAVQDALAEAERSPLTRAIEEYARARALLFAHILIEQLRQQLLAAPPTTASELIRLLDVTLEAAAGVYAQAVDVRGAFR
ncbi:MAG: hypothetical protein ACYDCQ_08575 [Dehalococcoidia bacterium]